MDVGVTVFLTDRALDVCTLARAVEDRGFSSLYLPEHTHLPLRQPDPPALVAGVTAGDYRRSVDPLVSLAAAAAVTGRIRLGTGIVLVAQHDPILLAKQVATLDRLSAGRVVLGVGYGWNRAEAEDHGLDFERRRAVAHEKLRCLRALWEQDEAAFQGEEIDLPPCWSWPKPAQPRLPVLFGGGAGPGLFRAIAELGDGWLPVGGGGVAAALPLLRRACEDAGRDPGAVRVVPFGALPEPGRLARYAEIGCPEVVLRVPAGGPDEVLPVLDDCARYVAALA